MKARVVKHSNNEWYKIIVDCECGKSLVIPIDECLLAAPDGRRICLRTDKIDIENDENKRYY